MRNRKKKSNPAVGFGIAAIAAALCLSAFASDSARIEKPTAVDAEQYADFIENEVFDIQDLAEGAEIQRRRFNRMTPPGFSWVQPMFPSVVPFDSENFDEKFLDELLGEDKNSVAIYPLSLTQDPTTRETLVFNAEGKQIATIPADRVSREWPENADPARVTLLLDLLPAEDVEPFLYTESRIEESLSQREIYSRVMPGAAIARSLGANEFGFAGAHRLTNGQMRLTATNGTDVAEIYSYTVWHTSSVVVTVWTNEYDEVVTRTNLVWGPTSPPYAGIESEWECRTTNLVLAGGVGTWDDADVSTNARVRFYAAAQRLDSDGDGLSDGMEILLYRTDPGQADTDGDGIPDGAEIDLLLDPLDPTDAAEDPDGDGFSNLLEYQLGSPLGNPAWNGEQLVYRLMHANTNHSLRVEVEDSENCGGTGLTQYVTNSLSVPDLLDCGYFLDITVTGNVEDHMSLYDHVYLCALDEKFYFGGDQNYVPCSYVAKTGTLNHLVLPNSQITLIYDTVSYKHHVNGYAEITGAAVTDILKVDTIDVTSTESGSSANAPPFAGHTPWPFDVTHSPSPDKHMVVFYKDVIDSSFNVQDFDVTLKANILPSSITADQLSEVWSKNSGPASGALDRTDTFKVKYQNPKLGGVYRFDFDLGLSGCAKSEANVILPLAGAEMDGVMQSDLPIANAFAAAVKARYNPNELQKFSNWRRWFWDSHAGDYTGRPDNPNTPTVWVYNQVNDVSGFGVVCTWKGRPVRLTKLSNFILGYAMQKIGASRAKARRGTGLFAITETTDRASVGAGWDVANGENYNTTVSNLVDYIWTNEAEDDKSRKLWPNPNAPDNYRGSSTVTPFDFNTGYGAPGFLFMTR